MQHRKSKGENNQCKQSTCPILVEHSFHFPLIKVQFGHSFEQSIKKKKRERIYLLRIKHKKKETEKENASLIGY